MLSASSMIIEGFICPECQQDMSSIELLQAHFQLVHTNKNNSKRSNNQNNSLNTNGAHSEVSSGSGFSSVLAKAKTLMSFDQTSEDQAESPEQASNSQSSSKATGSGVSYKFMKQYFNSNQNDGYFKSHTNEFKKLRDNTIGRYVIQTNKLLITLDKLISFNFDTLNDDSKRDAYYKSIVSWIDDKDVQLCPNCAKSFNMINRRHHCRLCGAIMCNKCSQFLSFTLAKRLTDPDSFIKAHESKHDDSTDDEGFKLRRSDSITSVNSYFRVKTSSSLSDSEKLNKNKVNKLVNTDQVYLRLCFDCSGLLEKKYKNLKDKIIRPEFANLYDELHSHMSESQRLYPVYTKMAESLSCGEAIYQLGNAEDIRNKLIKMFQKTEILSGSIQKYGCLEEDSVKISNDQMKLQRNLRSFAINFLREHSFNLPQLPSSQDYQKLKSQRQLHLIEEMRRTELEQNKQRKRIEDQMAKNQTNSKQKTAQNISIDNSNGWIPTVKPNILIDDNSDTKSNSDFLNETEDDDDSKSSLSSKSEHDAKTNALRIQIQVVEAYLSDALKHNKMEEADILQQNLNELLTILAYSK